MADEEYTQLKDLRLRINRGFAGGGAGGEDVDDGFSICFWVFLSGSTQPPVTVIHQMLVDEDRVPFLVLSQDKKLILFPLRHLHREAHPSGDSLSWTDNLSVSSKDDISLEKWIHIGYEVTRRYARLHIDGAVSAEVAWSFSSIPHSDDKNLDGVALMGNNGGDAKVQGYVYNLQILPRSILISNHFSKDPPLQLSLGVSSISDGVEECDDGIWSIIGGKASCHRNFSLEVILKDALGRPVHKEIELVASLVYADDGTSVEKLNDDAEASLLTNCDGHEFPSKDRPAKLIHGRMSFMLKMSQLSSNCENRLFRVHFQSTDARRYSFLEAYSPAIRCISRNRNSRTSNCSERKLSPTTHLIDCYPSQTEHEGSPEILDYYGGDDIQISNQCESMCIHSSKRLKLGNNGSLARVADSTVFQQSNERNFNALTTQGEKPEGRSSEKKIEHDSEMDDVASDSESSDAKHSSKRTQDVRSPLSDALVFRYCLEGMFERSMLLKEIIASANEEDVLEFANQVSMYAGCSHHRYQIMMAKQLIVEGVALWNTISRNNHHALWMDAIPEIERKFRKISHACRGLSRQDIEVLQRIAGCSDALSRENFEKLWCWLYPVAFTLSKEKMNKLWECLSPKWIEGLITKEEAENTLRGTRGLQQPGTFILRFPTTRSWPHPDAGSLVVTYVGADSILHNKLICLQESTRPRTLQDLILEEPELSQLGKVTTR